MSNIFFKVILIIFSLVTLACVIRSIIGPKFTDRLVAINMLGTVVIVVFLILGVYLKESYLFDVALVYAMISFLAVLVLTKVYPTGNKEVEDEEDAE